MQKKIISIVCPVLNEAENLPVLYRRIVDVFKQINYEFELILVESGSTDASVDTACELHRKDQRVKLLSLSRNFGHQVALSAGLDHATGMAVILMDSDLQHPPEIIPQLIEKWEAGFENVYTVREMDGSVSWVKRFSSSLFYKIFRFFTRMELPENSADFRLLDRKIVLQLRHFKERTRFLRGLICWVGYKSTGISYREERRNKGQTKYNIGKLLFLSIDAITSFTTVPLYLGVFVGFIIALVGFAYLLFTLYVFFFTPLRIPGWASIVSLSAFLGGFMLIIIGIIGIYIGKIFEEVKHRPLYFIDQKEGFDG